MSLIGLINFFTLNLVVILLNYMLLLSVAKFPITRTHLLSDRF